MGQKQQARVNSQYWQLEAVEASTGLIDFIKDRVQDLFGDKASLKNVVFNNRLRFVKGQFDFVGF